MATSIKPYRTRGSDLNPLWHVIDAEGKILGRLSSEIATLLQGKHKPIYVPYLNTGDYVVVINAKKIKITGNKLDQKVYYRHSGYHGGLKERTLAQLLQKTPTRVIQQAVKGMLPKNALGRRMLSRLKVYAEDRHPHQAQLARFQNPPKEDPPKEDPPKEDPPKEEKNPTPRKTRKPPAKAIGPTARQRTTAGKATRKTSKREES